MLWESHPEVETVKWIQAKSTEDDGALYEAEKETFEISEEGTEAVTDEVESRTESEEESAKESNSDEGTAAVQTNKFSALNDE